MSLNEGWIEEDKITFYYRENGALTEITARYSLGLEDNEQNRSDTDITIFGGSIGESESTYVDCKIIHQTFYVGTKANLLASVNHFDILAF
ncbi:MAG: hypothetical protein ACI8O8_000711 [Oleiphilaceae bacterium]|jgi:hypothetical protein